MLTSLIEALPGMGNASAIDISTTDAVLTPTCRRIWIGVSGDVTVDMASGQAAITFKNVPVGWLDVKASKVYQAGTTATHLIAAW